MVIGQIQRQSLQFYAIKPHLPFQILQSCNHSINSLRGLVGCNFFCIRLGNEVTHGGAKVKKLLLVILLRRAECLLELFIGHLRKRLRASLVNKGGEGGLVA